MPLHFSDYKNSVALKVHMEDIPDVALAKLLRDEQPKIGLGEALFFARLLKEVHRVGVVRGKIVKNA